MRRYGILLLLLVVFLCGPLPPADSEKQDRLERIEYEGNAYWKPYDLALHRQPREVSNEPAGALPAVPGVFLKFAELPVNVIRRILSVIAIVFRPLLLPVRGFLDALSRAGGTLPALKQPLSLAIKNPLAIPQQAISTVASVAGQQAESLLEQALIVSWKFLSTTGLPWLRRALDRVQQSPDLPDTARTMISAFDTFYNIAVLLGFISPAY